MWRLNLSVPECRRLDGADVLSDDELERADRLRFARHHCRFRRTRAALRLLLATYTSLDPARVALQVSDHGKPYLDLDGREPDIRFNVSHSSDLALFAFAQQHEVGIDVEYIRALDDLDALIAQVCTPEEQAELDAVSADQRTHAFFRLWTYKEACMKAAGMGLLVIPNQIQAAGRKSGIRVGDNSYRVHEIPVPAHYTAALAVDGSVTVIQSW